MNTNEAMDVVDFYGPNKKDWPQSDVAHIEDLYANDAEFRSYVDDQREIDKELGKWSEGVEGTDVGEGPETSKGDQQSDEEADPEIEINPSASEAEDEYEDDGSVIEIDPELLADMDKMFSDHILAAASAGDPGEFRVFSRDYDRVIEIPGVTDKTAIDPLDKAVAKTTGPLQKDLRRLIAARSQVRRSPGMRRGRLHAPNLHRIMAGDDRVFTRREEAQSMDTAISLVVDCSGSMAGEKLNLAAQTAYTIGSVLNKLNISFECLGFTDEYNNPNCNHKWHEAAQEASKISPITRSIPLVMPRFKEFDERWTAPVQRRFGHVFNHNGFRYDRSFPFGSTPEGCGVEFAARRLLRRQEERKIMIVMTDGKPYGQCLNSNGAVRYLTQARQVVEAVEASGVDIVGVGIKHDGPTGYYPRSLTINELEEMPLKLLAVLKQFIV